MRTFFIAVCAAKGTLTTVIDKLARTFSEGMRWPELSQRLSKDGIEVVESSPARFRDFLAADKRKWGDVIRNGKLSAASLFAVAASPNAVLSGAGFFLIGMAVSYSVTVINSTLQQRYPIHLRGGVVGLYGVAFLGGMPLGHLLMGSVASWLGAGHTLSAVGTAMLLSLWAIRVSTVAGGR